MATLEDKILGNKQHNYCSSSESGEESGDDDNDSRDGEDGARGPERGKSGEETAALPDPGKWDGVSSNTGPKGVIKDWQRFKQLEAEKRREQDAERLALMKKLSLTCKSALEEEKDKKLAEELKELESDEFLEQYRKQRMREMLSRNQGAPKFGTLHDLADGDQFLKAVDGEGKSVKVIIHVYEDRVPGCRMMNNCLAKLSQEYAEVKFCKLLGSAAGLSSHFKTDGVPALLVYEGGSLVGNFVRVTDELTDEFYEGDVESFLIERGVLVDKTWIGNIVSAKTGEDSDVSLE